VYEVQWTVSVGTYLLSRYNPLYFAFGPLRAGTCLP
jgi:hypothetical protein